MDASQSSSCVESEVQLAEHRRPVVSRTKRVIPYLFVFVLGSIFGAIVLFYAVSALLEAMHGPKWSGTTRLVEELNSGVVKQGDKLPTYADTHDFSNFEDVDDTAYGTNTFEERGRGINLTIFWYRPPSTNDRILHSAFLANGAKNYWHDRWFFYDPERMTIHVRLSEESARSAN